MSTVSNSDVDPTLPSNPAPDAPDAEAVERPLEVVVAGSGGGPDETESGAARRAEEVVFRVMSVESVLFDLSDASPQVHLMEYDTPYRNLSIPIALPEAQGLRSALAGTSGRRPSTHELTTDLLRRLRAEVIAARIVRYDEGVFYAELDVMTLRGREQVDCRASDALILALRQTVPAPVLCAEDVLALS